MLGVWLAVRGFIAFIPAFVWKWLAIALVLFAAYSYGDIRRGRIDKAEWDAAVLASKNAANDQDLQAEKESHAQDLEVTKSLQEQKKVDDAAIDDLKKQLASRPANAPCLYDKTNADPDGADPVPLPKPRSLRDRFKSGPRAGNKKPAGPTVLPSARRYP